MENTAKIFWDLECRKYDTYWNTSEDTIKFRSDALWRFMEEYASKTFEIWQQEYQARQAVVVDSLHKELKEKDELREADRKRIEQLKNELKNARLTVLVSLREDFIQGGMSYKEASEASRQHHRILAIDKALNL